MKVVSLFSIVLMGFLALGCEPYDENVYDDTYPRAYKTDTYGYIDLVNENGEEVNVNNFELDLKYNIELELELTNSETGEVTQKIQSFSGDTVVNQNGRFFVYTNLVVEHYERITSFRFKNLSLSTDYLGKTYSKVITMETSLYAQLVGLTDAYLSYDIKQTYRSPIAGDGVYTKFYINKSFKLKAQ